MFSVLKGSGNALGVATEFELRMYSTKDLEVAFIAIEWTHLYQVVRSLEEFNTRTASDKDASADLSVSFDATMNQTILVLMLTRTSDIQSSPLLPQFFDIQNVHHSVQKMPDARLARDIDMNNLSGFRQRKSTFPISNNASMVVGIIHIFVRFTAEYEYTRDPAYRQGFLVQPLTLSHLPHSRASDTGNMLGLEDSTEPLVRKS